MGNVMLIAKREYLERIRTRSFLVMTVLIPLVLGGLVYGTALMNGGAGKSSHIAVLSSDTRFAQSLAQELETSKGSTMKVDVVEPAAGERETLDGELKARKLDGYLREESAAAAGARPVFAWVTNAKADVLTRSTVASAVRTALARERLGQAGMPAAEIDGLMQPVQLEDGGGGKAGGFAEYASVFAIFLLMYFAILFYGMNVARSIIEEKTSRIFEVLLATIKPEEMMAGKVLGVGAVGLTQVGIWVLGGTLVLKSGLLMAGVSFPITALQVFFFVLFFVLGFALYSSLAAALGAMNNSEQELQQMQMALMLPLILCSLVLLKVVSDSDGLIAQAFSFFPFCTPLIMYVRIAVHQPPAWQIALSIFDLLVTVAIVLWFASRIYRVGILMYGKKPNLPEIMRWLTYS